MRPWHADRLGECDRRVCLNESLVSRLQYSLTRKPTYATGHPESKLALAVTAVITAAMLLGVALEIADSTSQGISSPPRHCFNNLMLQAPHLCKGMSPKISAVTCWLPPLLMHPLSTAIHMYL